MSNIAPCKTRARDLGVRRAPRHRVDRRAFEDRSAVRHAIYRQAVRCMAGAKSRDPQPFLREPVTKPVARALTTRKKWSNFNDLRNNSVYGRTRGAASGCH